MVFEVYQPDGTPLGIVERYQSMQWTRRLYEPGEFEMELPATPEHIDLLHDGRLIVRSRTDGDAGIIERVELEREPEGAMMTVSGRMLASVLERRVVLQEEALHGAAETVMLQLISDNCINVDEQRKIPGMSVPVTQGRGEIIDEQKAHGKSLLNVIESIAEEQALGFRIRFPSWEVEIVRGQDRSAEQTQNPWVILSVDGETLDTVSYSRDSAKSVNVATVYMNLSSVKVGDMQLESFTKVVGEASGLERREVYINASPKDAVVTVEAGDPDKGGGTITTTDYAAGALNVGRQALAKYSAEDVIDGQTSVSDALRLRRDYDLGDIVTVESREWGIRQNARITETVEIYDKEGERAEVAFGNRKSIRRLLERGEEKWQN